MKFVITLLLGFCFGSLLIATQAYSWFRIQEMFHFDSFHMYGVLFSAIATASLSWTYSRYWVGTDRSLFCTTLYLSWYAF